MQTFGTGAARLNLAFQIASVRSITLEFTESDGSDTDISLWTFEFLVKRFIGDRLKEISLTLGSGLSFPVYQDNQLLISVSASNSSAEEGEYYWELRRIDRNECLINGSAYFSFDALTGDATPIILTSGSQTITVR